MRRNVLRVLPGILVAMAAPSLFGQYRYYVTDSLTTINTSNWTQNGTLSATSTGLTSSNGDGGSLISTANVPDLSSNYEVKTTLALTQSGGAYVTYLRANSTALSGPAPAGTTYSVEVQNPTFSGSGCSATMGGYKIVGGSLVELAATTIPCSNGMTVRIVYTKASSLIIGYVNDVMYWVVQDLSITTGQPGSGVRAAPSGNSISSVQLGGIYTGAPTGFVQSNFGISAFPTEM